MENKELREALRILLRRDPGNIELIYINMAVSVDLLEEALSQEKDKHSANAYILRGKIKALKETLTELGLAFTPVMSTINTGNDGK